MKPTKILLTLFVLLILKSISIYAQDVCKVDRILNKTQLNEIEKAVSLYWEGKTEEAKQAVILLDEITKREPDNWVAPYWASYISTQIAEAANYDSPVLEKAQEYFDLSSKAFAKKPDKTAIPYFHALQALIYQHKSIGLMKTEDWQNIVIFKDKAKQELDTGINLSPENPVLMVLTANSIQMIDEVQRVNTITLLKKAQAEFKKITNRSPADITYWNEHWIQSWLTKLTAIRSS